MWQKHICDQTNMYCAGLQDLCIHRMTTAGSSLGWYTTWCWTWLWGREEREIALCISVRSQEKFWMLKLDAVWKSEWRSSTLEKGNPCKNPSLWRILAKIPPLWRIFSACFFPLPPKGGIFFLRQLAQLRIPPMWSLHFETIDPSQNPSFVSIFWDDGDK